MAIYKSVKDYRQEWEKWRDEVIARPYPSPEVHDFELWLINTIRREERMKLNKDVSIEG